jgi:ABC-type branched-subunit amino acid transport system permease subunit
MERDARRFRDEDFRPEPPPPAPKPAASLWGIFLAGVGALLIACALGFLMIPIAGVALAAVVLVFVLVALAAFHYVVWGWWLSGVIRDDVEAEERAEAEEERLRRTGHGDL